jgi:NhaB family Na+:H+ antiporter
MNAILITQALVDTVLILSLAFHVFSVGLVGLIVIVLLSAFNGIVEEHIIGLVFEEALPCTATLVVFFAIVAVIHELHLVSPVINYVLAMDPGIQPLMLFIANGVLSMISDDVFVTTMYINEVVAALKSGDITREQFDVMAVAIKTGENVTTQSKNQRTAKFY